MFVVARVVGQIVEVIVVQIFVSSRSSSTFCAPSAERTPLVSGISGTIGISITAPIIYGWTLWISFPFFQGTNNFSHLHHMLALTACIVFYLDSTGWHTKLSKCASIKA